MPDENLVVGPVPTGPALDAALLFDHDQPARMLECVERVLTDPDCAAALREKGLARAATFTWRRTAETTLALYREVAAR